MSGKTTSGTLIARTGSRLGLGNRLRLVLGCQALAQLENRSFYYTWPTGKSFGPKMNELWKFDAPTLPTTLSQILSIKFPYQDEKLAWLTDGKRSERIWQIKTGHALHLPPQARSWEEALRHLKPAQPVASRVVSSFSEGLSGHPYVGVMIRAHSASHSKTLAHSPVSWYLTRMLEIRNTYPDVKFFVSCDLESVQNLVMQRIGGCFAQQAKGAYNSVAGVQAAVADLYLLASSAYVLGPHFSSFAVLAQFLAGSELALETAMQPAKHPLNLQQAGSVLNPLRPSARTASPGADQ